MFNIIKGNFSLTLLGNMKSLQIAIAIVGLIVGTGCTPNPILPTPICSMPLVIGLDYDDMAVLRARPNEFSNNVTRKFQNVGSESVAVFFEAETDLLHMWDDDYKISYGEGITLDDGHEIEITFACSGGTPRTTVVSTTLQSNSMGTPIKTLFVCEIFEDEIVSKPDLIVQHWWDDALYVGYNEQETNVTGFHVINNGDAHAIVEFDYEHQQIQTRATVWNGIFPDRHYRQIIDPKGRAEFALSCFDMLPTYTETTISIYGIENEYTRHLVRTLKMTCAFNDFRSFPFSMTLSVPTPMIFQSESLATTTHQFKIRNAGIGNGRFKMDIPTGIHVVDEWGSEVTSNSLIDIARYHLRSFNVTVDAGVVPDNYAIILNDEGEWSENERSVGILVVAPKIDPLTTTTTTPTTIAESTTKSMQTLKRGLRAMKN